VAGKTFGQGVTLRTLRTRMETVDIGGTDGQEDGRRPEKTSKRALPVFPHNPLVPGSSPGGGTTCYAAPDVSRRPYSRLASSSVQRR